MKEFLRNNILKCIIRALRFGIAYAIMSFFVGGVRYPYNNEVYIPPVWLQIIILFLVSAMAYFLVSIIGYIFSYVVKRKKDI